MIVRCPSCRAKFRVPESKIKSSGTKVRCGRCKAIFRVFPHDEAEDSSIHSKPTAFGSSGVKRPRADGSTTRPVGDSTKAELLKQVSESAEDPNYDPWGDGISRPTPDSSAPSSNEASGDWLMNITSSKTQQEMATFDSDDESSEPVPRQEDTADRQSLHLLGNSAESWEWEEAAPSKTIDGGDMEAPASLSLELSEPHDLTGLPPDDELQEEFAGPLDIERPSRYSASLQALHDMDKAGQQPAPIKMPPPSDLSSLLQAAPPATNPEAPEEPEAFQPPQKITRKTGESKPVVVKEPAATARGGFSAETTARWLAGLVVVILVMTGFFGYVAAKNSWVLDFSDPNRMLGVAFKGYEVPSDEYERIRVYELDGEIIESPTNDTATPQYGPLSIGDVQDSFYITRTHDRLLLVEGFVRNNGDALQRRIFVKGTAYRGDEVYASVVAPVGAAIPRASLDGLYDEGQVEAYYEELDADTASLGIGATQIGLFTLVLFANDLSAEEVEQMTFAVELVQSEYRDANSAWRRIVYNSAPSS